MPAKLGFRRELTIFDAETVRAPSKDREALIRMLKLAADDYAVGGKRVSCCVKIDGDLAASLLRYNWNNRPLASMHIEKMIGDAVAHRFPLMPEPIIFITYEDNGETFVWDGQSRLHTARIFNGGLWFNVEVLFMDREQEPLRRAAEAETRRRSTSDIVTELNLSDTHLLDTTRLYLYPEMQRAGMISTPQLIADQQRIGPRLIAALQTFDRLLSEEDKILLGTYRSGIGIGMLHSFELDAVNATDFFSLFFRPNSVTPSIPDSHVVKVLRREILARKIGKDARTRSNELRTVVYLAFTWFSTRRHHKHKVTEFEFELVSIPSAGIVPRNVNDKPPENLDAVEWMTALDFSEPPPTEGQADGEKPLARRV